MQARCGFSNQYEQFIAVGAHECAPPLHHAPPFPLLYCSSTRPYQARCLVLLPQSLHSPAFHCICVNYRKWFSLGTSAPKVLACQAPFATPATPSLLTRQSAPMTLLVGGISFPTSSSNSRRCTNLLKLRLRLSSTAAYLSDTYGT